MNKVDCVFCSIPFIEYYLPAAAPAVLKGHLQSKGFVVNTFDFNISVKEKFEGNELIMASAYFSNRSKSFDEKLLVKIDSLVNEWVDKLLAVNPRFIGISVFSNDSRKACEMLLDRLAERQHDCKVFIGGMGVDEEWLDTIRDKIDYYIMGEGELACENLLKGNTEFKGINGRVDQMR